MFTIRAKYSDKVEVKSNLEKVREFFGDIKNFVELMPSVESIHTDAKGIAHWTIRAEIPIVGAMVQKFAVEPAENDEERIEWIPVSGETKNLLRYAAEFIEKGKDITIVQFTQAVEMRRDNARELHLLAGLAGESIISNEMTKKIAEMLKIFFQRAQEKLEA